MIPQQTTKAHAGVHKPLRQASWFCSNRWHVVAACNSTGKHHGTRDLKGAETVYRCWFAPCRPYGGRQRGDCGSSYSVALNANRLATGAVARLGVKSKWLWRHVVRIAQVGDDPYLAS